MIIAILFNVALAAYAAAVAWGPLRNSIVREPPAYMRPILEFWGFQVTPDGYAQLQRYSAGTLAVVCSFSALVLIVVMVTKS